MTLEQAIEDANKLYKINPNDSYSHRYGIELSKKIFLDGLTHGRKKLQNESELSTTNMKLLKTAGTETEIFRRMAHSMIDDMSEEDFNRVFNPTSVIQEKSMDDSQEMTHFKIELFA